MQEAMNWLSSHFIYTADQVAQLRARREAEATAVTQGTAKPGTTTRRWHHVLNLNRRGKC